MSSTPTEEEIKDLLLNQVHNCMGKSPKECMDTINEATAQLDQLIREEVAREVRHIGNLVFQLQQELGDNPIFDRILIGINKGLLKYEQGENYRDESQGNG